MRSLAGLIRNCGLLKREHAGKVQDAYRLYRQRSNDTHPNSDQAVRFRQDFAIEDLTSIEFVGVWDTVGALGIPIPFLGSLGESDYVFHDTEPSRIIQHARHAVSIDENRKHFDPTLWSRKEEVDIQQVWFAGVHSDIGGGYVETGLSHCAMEWMIQEAKILQFEFEDHLHDTIHPDHTDVQHDERKGFYLLDHKMTRNVSEPLHISVKNRWEENIHNYRRTSRALTRFLKGKDNDWNRTWVNSLRMSTRYFKSKNSVIRSMSGAL